MGTGILKFLGACAAALSFAMPASAFTVSLNTVGQDLQVSLIGLGGDTITAYDVFVGYDAALAGDILGIDPSAQLGDTSILDALFVSSTSTAGVLEGAAVSFLTNAEIEALKTDPLLLFTVHFDAAADLSTAGFSFAAAASTFGCAVGDPSGYDVVRCSPAGAAVPEPTSIALVSLALIGAGVGRRRRAAG